MFAQVTPSRIYLPLCKKNPQCYSRAGLLSLFDYFEQLEIDADEPIDLDYLLASSEYIEFDSLDQFRASYGEDYPDLDSIREKTAVIPIDSSGAFIIENF